MTTSARRFLFAMFDGGGNVPPLLAVAGELSRRGHRVDVLAPEDAGGAAGSPFARGVERAGARLVPVRLRRPREFGVPPAAGLLLGRTTKAFGPLCFTHTQYAFAPSWAEAVAARLASEDADVLAADHMLPGALVGAEAAGRPAAALLHTIYFFRPAPGLPPPGIGLVPARTPIQRVRERIVEAAIDRVYRRDAVPLVNLARRRFGLADVSAPFAEYDRAGRVLVMTSPAFDLPSRDLPANVRYTGMPFEPPRPTAAWIPPWPADDSRPLVVVAFSTNPQGQQAVLRRLIPAFGGLDVRVLVTLGPALEKAMFAAPPNVWLVPWAPHDLVMPQARLVVTHGGHGTVMQALRHGVPVACVPLCCDQYDIAVRVALRRVGTRLSSRSHPAHFGADLRGTLADTVSVQAARHLGARMAKENGAATAADELVALAQP